MRQINDKMIYLIAAYANLRSVFAKDANVMSHFTVEALQREQLRETWPVVRTSGLEANADWWVHDAAELIERGGGVLVARAPDGSIHGVATYAVVRSLPLASVLAVEMIITFELNRRAPARQSLCEALERLATALNCTGIRLPISTKAARITSPFYRRGWS